MRVLTVKNTREAEALANESGISYLQLMENAGSYCARVIRKTFANTSKKRVLVICGKGRNGGDGCVIARKLSEDGYSVTVMMAMGLPSDSESSEMLSRIRAMGVNIIYYDRNGATDRAFENAEIIVDCIFGIGFHGEPDEQTAGLFGKINASPAVTVSIDVPSGLSGDSGRADGECVKADLTVAVMALKPVHVLKPSRYFCGQIVTASIGIPEKCFEAVKSALFTMDDSEVKRLFKKREADSHKGTYGTVLVIGGSYEMPNAAYFASQAAADSGAGIVKLAFPAAAYKAIAPKTYEQVLIPLESNKNGRISQNAVRRIGTELEKCSCVVIGCGMGVDEDTKAVVKFVLENSPVPVIVDADGINCLKGRIELIDSVKADVILTPHPKEMSRIAGTDVRQIENGRSAAVSAFISAHRSVLVLKGASTLVGGSENGSIYVNPNGNPGMATGGSGDVLSGIIASFAAQGLSPFLSAAAGVYVHGAAGDSAAAKYSMMGTTPSKIISELPFVMKKFE